MTPVTPLSNKDELSGFRPLADINVTPFVDVMLVLLIIFMVTAPMLVAGLNVNLPQANRAQPVAQKAPLIVTVTKDGGFLVGKNDCSRDALAETVRNRLGDDAERPVYIQGDRETLYGNVIAAIDLLTEAGFRKVVMIVERRSPADATPSQPDHDHSRGGVRPWP